MLSGRLWGRCELSGGRCGRHAVARSLGNLLNESGNISPKGGQAVVVPAPELVFRVNFYEVGFEELVEALGDGCCTSAWGRIDNLLRVQACDRSGVQDKEDVCGVAPFKKF